MLLFKTGLRSKGIGLLMILSLTLSAAAQKNSDAVLAVARLLQQELQKADVGISEVHTNGRAGQAGFQLALLDTKEAALYKLGGMPPDAFYIKSSNRSVYIGSTTPAGLRNGVYWYLNELGFRYYFPDAAWHFVPRLTSPFLTFDKTVTPSYLHRRIWYAYGTDSRQADVDYRKWFEANLMGGEQVNAGHSYDAIVNRNKAVFLQHPEYFAQKVEKGRIPPDPKFEVSNEDLVQLCIQDAFEQIQTALQKNGALPDMISMDPSDGGGFSTSAAALKIGGPSEQTFYLANRVAKAVRQKYPSVKVGLYAYFTHIVPPKFDLEPNIVVLIATALNLSAYRTEELIEMWKKKGALIGIRDYYGVMAWDWDMPGQPRGSKLGYVSSLKKYYSEGIRLFTAETNIGWISRGLGHYIAARLLWDVTTNVQKTSNEFYQQMFGKAASPMKELYQHWQQYNQANPAPEDMAVWYQLVHQASAAESSAAVQTRIGQVKQYLHYVYLFQQWKKEGNDANLVALLNYAYRIKDNGAVASYPLARRLANSAVKGKANMRFNDKDVVWKRNASPVSAAETEQAFQEVAASFKNILKTVPVAYPQFFKKPMPLKTTGRKNLSAVTALRGPHKIIFRLDDPTDATLIITAGTIKLQNFKTLRLQVFTYRGGLSAGADDLVLDKALPPKQPAAIPLSGLQPGSYIISIDDAKGGFNISFSGAVAYGIVADKQSPIWTIGRNNLVFTVPERANKFTIQTTGVLTLRSPAGRVLDLQKRVDDPIVVDVKENEYGIWQMQRQSGTFYLQGMLPFVCPDVSFLLTP
jgi:hypothetical protein